ncbi:unnamed protein product [Cylindrotheca closterium]|uniref:Uncharacterized protein n=1 Tax=Cylindrotheca closterium TaxID=2856 RepID=A0AAD2G6T8_9STRA|nr:unnamed protein product [Cylindrotheca closterium]
MAFQKLKKRLLKKKSPRTNNGVDLKSSADDSQRTCRTMVSDSPPSSRTVLESTPELVQPAMYGYEDAAPDAAAKSLSLDPYGYEVHDPSPVAARPRRSSMKGLDPTRPPRRRHSISFEKEVKVNKVVPIATMVKDKGDMWLQGQDYSRIANKVNRIVERSASGKGDKFCVRGLEHMIERRAGKEDEPRTEAWDTVLDEQHTQCVTGNYSEETLSQKYILCSKQSRMEAKLRALQDEQEVSRYLEETRHYCRRMSM